MFSSTLWGQKDLQNSIPRGPSFELRCGLQNTHARDDPFIPLIIDMIFLQKRCKRLVYDKFCFQFDTSLAPIPRTIYSPDFNKALLEWELRNIDWNPELKINKKDADVSFSKLFEILKINEFAIGY